MCLITNFTETKTLTPSEKMKQFLVFVVLILVFGFSAAGEPDKPKNPPTPIELICDNLPDNSKDRLRMPTRHDRAKCFYEDGYLHLTFEYPEGNATISITDIMDTPCLTQQFSTFTLFTLYIGEPTEPLNIKVTTEANIYTGMLITL